MSENKSVERVRLDIDGGIGTISLDRANKLNALYPEMILRLVDLIEEVRRNSAVRVLVLRGEGRAFCAARRTRNRRYAPMGRGAVFHQ